MILILVLDTVRSLLSLMVGVSWSPTVAVRLRTLLLPTSSSPSVLVRSRLVLPLAASVSPSTMLFFASSTSLLFQLWFTLLISLRIREELGNGVYAGEKGLAVGVNAPALLKK